MKCNPIICALRAINWTYSVHLVVVPALAACVATCKHVGHASCNEGLPFLTEYSAKPDLSVPSPGILLAELHVDERKEISSF